MAWVLDRLYHLHWVTPELARSAQPYMGFYAQFLRPHGFRTLINLRGENAGFSWWRREKAVAAELEIDHFDVRLSSRNIPSRSGLAALVDAFEKAKAPILIKCSGGQDRTGFAAALYLLETNGPSALERAEAQFALWPYLHRPKRHQLWLKRFPRYAVEQMGTMTLRDWARTRYDPQHFAEWLGTQGLGRSFFAFQAEVT
jgi:protein tyrosine/serine phosphatase